VILLKHIFSIIARLTAFVAIVATLKLITGIAAARIVAQYVVILITALVAAVLLPAPLGPLGYTLAKWMVWFLGIDLTERSDSSGHST
jgi:hypothetical protein